MVILTSILAPIRTIFGTKVTITWPNPQTWPDGWESALRTAARDADLSTTKLVVENGKVVASFRNQGHRANLGSRIHDIAFRGAEHLGLADKQKRLIDLSVYSPLGLLKSLVLGIIILIIVGLIAAALLAVKSWWGENPTPTRSAAAFGPLALIGFGILVAIISSSETDIRAPFDRKQAELRQQRRRLVPLPDRLDAEDDSPSANETYPLDPDELSVVGRPSLDDVEIFVNSSIEHRARAIRDDRDFLQDRARSAYRLACLFLLLSLGGPGLAGWLLFSKGDWHFLLASLSLAAVPLAVGLALLRHDTKLREQHGESEAQLEVLDRLKIALEYAEAADKALYAETRKQVIAVLLKSAERQSVRSVNKRKRTGQRPSVESEGEGALDIVQKMGDVVSAVLPKGS